MSPTRELERACTSGTLVVSTFQSSGTQVDMSNCAGGMIYMPSGNSCTLTFHSSHNGSDFFTVYDKTATVVTRTISNANQHQCIPVPDECYGSSYLEVTSDVAVDDFYYILKG